MAYHNRFSNNRKRPGRPARAAVADQPAFEIPAKKPPKVYGKAFTLLEDEQKNAFEYRSGAWVPYAMTIAQCREEGEVKQLPQKINKMTRYEVRLPVGFES
jgi:hypothetical protein